MEATGNRKREWRGEGKGRDYRQQGRREEKKDWRKEEKGRERKEERARAERRRKGSAPSSFRTWLVAPLR